MTRASIASVLIAVCGLGMLPAAAPAADSVFQAARPVWPAGRDTEMNLSVGFTAAVERPAGGRTRLRLATSTIYRLHVNGQFVGHGPARGPHGFYRFDQWDLTERLTAGRNVVAIEVAGYNVNSYYLLDQPSFLQAEVACGDQVLAATGGAAFSARVLDDRVQKVPRYSFQRPFTEVYRLQPGFDRWRREGVAPAQAAALAVQPVKPLLPRGVAYPDFRVDSPVRHVARGTLVKREPVKLWKDRALVNIGPALKGYPESELAAVPSVAVQHFASPKTADLGQPWAETPRATLGAGAWQILDFGNNLTGFLGAQITCAKPATLWFLFDEILAGGDVDFKRLGCASVVEYQLVPGVYEVETLEPYTLRYLKLACPAGACEVEGVYLRELAHPEADAARFACNDERLNQLFAAGVRTFRQNALDVFMDCPSRERAGWLCDSFFTAQVEHDLTGTTRIERNFFENFLLPQRFAHLPDGMLPMCYPADHNDGVFIPNWSLWFVVQLEQFALRGGDRTIVEGLRPKVLALMKYFRTFENADGLLEKLPSWVFVEWSAANRFVQDVNYPSNMLYAGALSAAGRLYGAPELATRAEKVRQTVRQQAFDGTFFVDNAIRRNGRLEVTRNRTEVCQYFAFFFDVATSETHAGLWATLRDKFGPQRKATKAFPDVHPANSFVGNMVRMELLSRYGRNQQILDESIAYLLYMAERTGTLWENVDPGASCNHGFASHIVHTLYRDVLGVYQIDPVAKRVRVRLGAVKLEHCSGQMPTPAGPIDLRWRRAGGQIRYQLTTPPGYLAEIENLTGAELVREGP